MTSRPASARAIIAVALGGMFATTFPVTILTVALPDMAVELGSTEARLSLVVSLPLMLSAVALPVLGKLGDLRGHRRTYLAGFVVALLATIATATAWNDWSLIAFRTVAIVAGSATQPSSMALMLGVTEPSERSRVLGWWGATVAGAPAIGLAIGGPLIDLFGWRIVFGLQAVLQVAVLLLAVRFLPETPPRPQRFDVAGAITLGLAAGGVLLVVTEGRAWGWTHPVVPVTAVVSVVAARAFWRAEQRADSPLLPPHLAANREFVLPLAATALIGGAYMGGFFLAPLLLDSVFALSATLTSLVLLTRPVVFAASSPVGGARAVRHGNRTVAVVGTGLIAVSLAALAAGSLTAWLPVVLVGLVCQGAGQGVARPPIVTAMAATVPDEDLGLVAAAERMVFQVGSSLGVAVMVTVYGGQGDADRLAAAYVVGAVMALGAVVAVRFLAPVDAQPDTPAGEDRSARPVTAGKAKADREAGPVTGAEADQSAEPDPPAQAGRDDGVDRSAEAGDDAAPIPGAHRGPQPEASAPPRSATSPAETRRAARER